MNKQRLWFKDQFHSMQCHLWNSCRVYINDIWSVIDHSQYSVNAQPAI